MSLDRKHTNVSQKHVTSNANKGLNGGCWLTLTVIAIIIVIVLAQAIH